MTTAATLDLVRLDLQYDGALAVITLSSPPGNVLDLPMMQALSTTLTALSAQAALRAVILTGAGKHFSFGASVPEHLPASVGTMLPRFHQLMLQVLKFPVPVIAAIRGACLGGGLELALVCHRIVGSAECRLGQPEITLGVFAPVASLLLASRIGQARAEDLCLSGRVIEAPTALAWGLLDDVTDDPVAASIDWAVTNYLSRSAVALRHAMRAVRWQVIQQIQQLLPLLEHAYLNELMATADATEGLQAFLDKRSPVWRHE